MERCDVVSDQQRAVDGAGHKFQAIAQQNLEDTKALTNWAKSICIRASLKDRPEVCQKRCRFSVVACCSITYPYITSFHVMCVVTCFPVTCLQVACSCRCLISPDVMLPVSISPVSVNVPASCLSTGFDFVCFCRLNSMCMNSMLLSCSTHSPVRELQLPVLLILLLWL